MSKIRFETLPSLRRTVMRALPMLLLAGIVACVLATGCARPKPSPGELLSQAMIAYHGHLVFERFDQAAGFVPVPRRDAFMEYYEDQRGDLRILEFEVTRVEISDDELVAEAEIMLSWYKLPSMTLQTSRMDQSWRFDELEERWEVVEQTVREDSASAED